MVIFGSGRRRLKGCAGRGEMHCYYPTTSTLSPILFLFCQTSSSPSFLPDESETHTSSLTLNSSYGRSADDLSFSVAYRHYLKRIKTEVVENLSATKLVLLSECIIYRLYSTSGGVRVAMFLITNSLTLMILRTAGYSDNNSRLIMITYQSTSNIRV